MTEAELIAMIRVGRTQESSLCERKPDGRKDQEVRKTVVAFANSTPDGQEAVLFIGLNDKTGAVEGVDNADKLQKRCVNVLDECYPAITRHMYALTIDGKTVVAIVVPASRHKPHFAGGAYVRDGSQSNQASNRLYEDLILSRTDPARELIKYKTNHTIVAVRGINYRLGSHKPFSGTHN
jgi:predicted HTH transcriptional regulator